MSVQYTGLRIFRDCNYVNFLCLSSGSQSENYLRQESQAVVRPFPGNGILKAIALFECHLP